MELTMTFKHMDTSDSIKAYTREKCEALAKYFNGKTKLSWNFSVDKERFVAHCHLVGNNMDYFGQAETTDLRASIDMVLDKIETQIRKHKEVVTNHKVNRSAAS